MPRTPGEIGQTFYRKVHRWLESLGFSWIYRMPVGYWHSSADIPVSPPFDLIAIGGGVICCVECKSRRTFLRMDEIKPHQFLNLLKVAEAGAQAFVAVEFRDSQSWYIIDIKSLDICRRNGVKKISDVEAGKIGIRIDP